MLTGALIIGDSVKHSLKHLVYLRLGNIKYAMQTGDRFVRAQLSEELAVKLNSKTSSVLLLKGIGINTTEQKRINNIQVIGIDQKFWELSCINMTELNEDEVIISKNCAQRLNLQANNEFLLRVENINVIPVNAPFVAGNNPTVSLRLKVKAIAADEELGRFSLISNQNAPANIFISREFLARQIELKDMVNTILVSESEENNWDENKLNEILAETWKFKDAGLTIQELTKSQKYELRSTRIFLEDPITNAALNLEYPAERILTYLVNSIKNKTKETPYSFVSAVSPEIISSELAENEIVINDWMAKDLKADIGDSILLEYYIIGPLRTLEEESQKFVIKDILPLKLDPEQKALMPDFPGLSDAGSCRDWNAGIPINLDKIRDKDEKYWNTYRGTPKAFISINTGIKLWNNRFGKYTAFRFDKNKAEIKVLKNEILENLMPQDLNLVFLPVYEMGINSANNAVDFSGLFLSLSFFVIVSGILLTVLIYALNVQSRNEETGILAGLGFEKKQILKLQFIESFFIALLGGILGALAGIFYNYGLLLGLNTLWQDAVHTNMLNVYLNPNTLIIGALSGIFIALIAIYIISKRNLSQPIIGILRSYGLYSMKFDKRKNVINNLILFGGFIAAALIVIYSFINSIEENAGLLLSAGGMLLIALISSVNSFLHKKSTKLSGSSLNIMDLAIKNASRNKTRSIATIALLAIGTFSIIITGANRKTFQGTENQRNSGTGGFLYWIETTLPIIYDLNSDEGKNNYGILNEAALNNVDFLQFHRYNGNDASCLNLNQVQNPNILGIHPVEFDQKQSFSFTNLLKGIDKENPWLELSSDFGQNIIPAFADQTVITWGMKKKVGDTLYYLNESGKELKILLIGGLSSSVFQGNILIADSLFTKHFPSVGGSKIMLIDAPVSEKKVIAEALNTNFIDYGIDVNLASERLAEFNAVENTYLSVFMALGGLGVIIGTFGLGIVLLRNILERRHELGLLLATGFRKRQIFKLIFIENLFLLLSGIACGLIAALIGILPSILSPSFTIPSLFILLLVVLILISGIIWIYFPAKNAIKGELIAALRDE